MFRPGDSYKIAKKTQFSQLDEAKGQLVEKTYSGLVTTSSLFFSLSNEIQIIKIEIVLDRATIHGTGAFFPQEVGRSK